MKEKVKKLRLLFSILYDSIFASLILAFLEVLFIKESPDLFIIPITIILFFLSYALREWAPNIVSILLSHFLLLGVTYVFPFSLNIRILFALVALYLFYSSILYIRRGFMIAPIIDLPWPSFLISVVIYFFSIILKDDTLKMFSYVIPICMLLIYYLITYFEGISSYIDATQDVSGMPLKKIIHTNSTLVFAIILFLIGGLFLGKVFIRYDIANQIGNFILKIIYYIVYAILYVCFQFVKLLKTEPVYYKIPQMDVFLNARTDNLNNFLNILVYVVFLLFSIQIIVKLFHRFVLFLLKKRQPKSDKIETIIPDKIYEIRKEKAGKKNNEVFNLRVQIRKMYKKKILSYKDNSIYDSTKSCRDIMFSVSDKFHEDITELTDLYSKVRYSNMEMTNQNLKDTKKLCKK